MAADELVKQGANTLTAMVFPIPPKVFRPQHKKGLYLLVNGTQVNVPQIAALCKSIEG